MKKELSPSKDFKLNAIYEDVMEESIEFIDELFHRLDWWHSQCMKDCPRPVYSKDPSKVEVPLKTESFATLLTISGAGDDESRAWTDMLYNMYFHYAIRFMDSSVEGVPMEGDGIKLRIVGPYSEEWKREAGIHRLIRISPFDKEHRRHTSFATVTVGSDEDEGMLEMRRSYIFHPYRSVVDHKTGVKTDKIDNVLIGELSLLHGIEEGLYT